ncbi:MAG: hypothetical protein IT175_00495 [Acidobacteria bacterium]|nr:hypothetical protein [Acidobacteriota bacterium]
MQLSWKGQVPPPGSNLSILEGQTLSGERLRVVPGSQRTLVLFLSTRCPYCDEQVPFWKTLVKALEERRKPVEVVFVMSEVYKDDAKAYFEKFGLKDRALVFASRADLAAINLGSTPSTLLVDQAGIVTNSWAGRWTGSTFEAVESAMGVELGTINGAQQASSSVNP